MPAAARTTIRGDHRTRIRGAVVHWLMSDFHLFGLDAQNWMWAFPAVLLLYAVVHTIIRARRTSLHR
jgi:hypothetical protein